MLAYASLKSQEKLPASERRNLLHPQSDLNELTLQQVKWVKEREQQRLVGFVEQYELALNGRAQARVNLKALNEYLEQREPAELEKLKEEAEERRAEQHQLISDLAQATGAIGTGSAAGSLAVLGPATTNEALGPAEPVPGAPADDDLPFDDETMDEAEEAEEEGED